MSTTGAGPQLTKFVISRKSIDPSNPSVSFDATFASQVGINVTQYSGAVQIKFFDAAGVQQMSSNYHTADTNPTLATFTQTRSLTNVLKTDGLWTVALVAKDLKGNSNTWTATDLEKLGFAFSVQVNTKAPTPMPTPAGRFLLLRIAMLSDLCCLSSSSVGRETVHVVFVHICQLQERDRSSPSL